MALMRVAVLAAVAAGAAVGLAVPASAELTEGSYTSYVSEVPGYIWVFSSCGQGCMRMEVPATGAVDEFRLEGTNWVSRDGSRTTTIDPSLAVTTVSGDSCPVSVCPTIHSQLVRVD